MCLGLQEEPNRYYQGNSQSIDNTIIVDIRLNLVLPGILGSGLFVVLSATCFALCPGKISRLLKLFLSTMISFWRLISPPTIVGRTSSLWNVRDYQGGAHTAPSYEDTLGIFGSGQVAFTRLLQEVRRSRLACSSHVTIPHIIEKLFAQPNGPNPSKPVDCAFSSPLALHWKKFCRSSRLNTGCSIPLVAEFA